MVLVSDDFGEQNCKCSSAVGVAGTAHGRTLRLFHRNQHAAVWKLYGEQGRKVVSTRKGSEGGEHT